MFEKLKQRHIVFIFYFFGSTDSYTKNASKYLVFRQWNKRLESLNVSMMESVYTVPVHSIMRNTVDYLASALAA